ncbi:hypothetical protein OUZ56_017305 [Daphnia magna]|uniref:Uncharacterized protein n=1 Tax=Daphnia magna TaxID=35525 RepID=A0ABR0ASN8_9CRUS|nr:hypothetical protein OUZ56_017305 [Daphnia magna]
MRALCPVGLNKPNVTEDEFLDRSRKVDVNLLLQHKGAKDQVIYRHVEQKKNRTGCSREALIGTTLPSDEDIANELKKCQQIAKQKMNKLGVILTGKDVTNFSFCPSYGQQITKNTFRDNDLEESDDEENPLDDDSSDEIFDSYDLQVLHSLHQVNFRDFSKRLSAQSVAIPLSLENQSSERTSVGAAAKVAPSAFVKISDSEANVRIVQKKTVCWFLESGLKKISNDRILRVRQLATFVDVRKLIYNFISAQY